MNESIKDVLMRRNNLSSKEAEGLIDEAKDALNEYLMQGDTDSAENICQEYFGLEPDFLMDLA